MEMIFKNDTRNILLTPKFITKSDLDIKTINDLSKYATSVGSQLVLTGGYATEAHLGGKITRAHGHIDCVFLNVAGIFHEELLQK